MSARLILAWYRVRSDLAIVAAWPFVGARGRTYLRELRAGLAQARHAKTALDVEHAIARVQEMRPDVPSRHLPSSRRPDR